MQIRCNKYGANSVQQIRCKFGTNSVHMVGVDSVQMACGANTVQIEQYGANSVQLSGTRCKFGAPVGVIGANTVQTG